jgi:hypothetical protein
MVIEYSSRLAEKDIKKSPAEAELELRFIYTVGAEGEI